MLTRGAVSLGKVDRTQGVCAHLQTSDIGLLTSLSWQGWTSWQRCCSKEMVGSVLGFVGLGSLVVRGLSETIDGPTDTWREEYLQALYVDPEKIAYSSQGG